MVHAINSTGKEAVVLRTGSAGQSKSHRCKPTFADRCLPVICTISSFPRTDFSIRPRQSGPRFCVNPPQAETVCRWPCRATVPHQHYDLCKFWTKVANVLDGFCFRFCCMSRGRAYSAFYRRMDSAVGIHCESFARTASNTLGIRGDQG